MSKSNTTENDTINALVRGIDPSWRANANRYIALHTADPGDAGTAVTNECSYTGYARVAVDADTGFSAASGGSTANTGIISFDECDAGYVGTQVVTYWSIVTTASGAGQIIYSAELTAPRSISAGITPQFAPGQMTVLED